jgi:LemA protein
MTGYIILAIAVALVLWGAATFNGLVRRRNMVAEGWSGIEAQLKRRADLIPNLVETVKGYASHERGTLDELTKLRLPPSKPRAAMSRPAPKPSGRSLP